MPSYFDEMEKINWDDERRFQDELDDLIDSTSCNCEPSWDSDGVHHEMRCAKTRAFLDGFEDALTSLGRP